MDNLDPAQISTRLMSTNTVPLSPSGAATKTSTTVSAIRSSTTRSGTCTASLAPMGKYRIGAPSRITTTVTSSSVLLPPRKYTGWVIAPAGTTYRSDESSGDGASYPLPSNENAPCRNRGVLTSLMRSISLQNIGGLGAGHRDCTDFERRHPRMRI